MRHAVLCCAAGLGTACGRTPSCTARWRRWAWQVRRGAGGAEHGSWAGVGRCGVSGVELELGLAGVCSQLSAAAQPQQSWQSRGGPGEGACAWHTIVRPCLLRSCGKLESLSQWQPTGAARGRRAPPGTPLGCPLSQGPSPRSLLPLHCCTITCAGIGILIITGKVSIETLAGLLIGVSNAFGGWRRMAWGMQLPGGMGWGGVGALRQGRQAGLRRVGKRGAADY